MVRSKWKTFGTGTKNQTLVLSGVPFQMEPVQKEIKNLVEHLKEEEIIDVFAKFCDIEMKLSRVGSDTLKDHPQQEDRSTYQCPECFTDWPVLWDPTNERACGKKVLPIKKTKHLTNMQGTSGNWLLCVIGKGITWVRDGDLEPEIAYAQSKVTWKHAVDIGALTEAPLCPADHSETSLSDFISSSDRVQLRTEVLNRVVDAAFPLLRASKNLKQGVPPGCGPCFEACGEVDILTSADVPPEKAYHPKRSEEEMSKVVQDNSDIIHDLQCGALGR